MSGADQSKVELSKNNQDEARFPESHKLAPDALPLKALTENSQPDIQIVQTSSTQSPPFLGKVWGKLQETVQQLGQTSAQAGQTIIQTAATTGKQFQESASHTGETVLKTTQRAGQELGETTAHLANSAAQATTITGSALTKTTTQTGKMLVNTASAVGNAIGQATSTATTNAGHMATWVSHNPLFKPVTKTLRMDWLVALLDKVDVDQAEEAVRKLQAQYPNESPSQIAHRLMVKKATLSAGTGLASSALPGFAAALLVLDFSFTMSLQAEMVYQIAAAYGLDLQDPARKGEVLAIFGLSIGGSKALSSSVRYATKAGFLGFLRNVPAAGAVIGASSNAAMTYSLGYAACRFYESQVNVLASESALKSSEVASEQYLQTAIAQETVMDQILMHVIRAAHSERTWQEIVPLIQQMHLSPGSLESLEQNEDRLPPLKTLLNQINPDFAAPLVAQCQQIVRRDGMLTPAEADIMQQITDTLQVDWPDS